MNIFDDKVRLQGIIAFLTIIVGCILLILGFLVPPMGIIDNSVLVAFGEICTFVGALVGIDYSYKSKLLKNDNNKTATTNYNA